ncbi:MAG: sulfatase [Planctomycetes bacterium]|nr:sulfatase [Planctomycetota bacterium]
MPAAKTSARPNVLLIAVDSLRADHMSCYGYGHQTTPHIDRFAQDAVLFEQTYSAHIPTTSAYASMLTGRDCFGTQVVALRHQGDLTPKVTTLAEILRGAGYRTGCVGFTGNPTARGFDQYLDYPGWGSWNEGRSPKAQNLNDVTHPLIDRLARQSPQKPFFLMLRHMDTHSPYLPPAPFERMFYHGDERDPKNRSMQPVMAFKPFADFFSTWMPPGITDKDYVVAQYDGAVAYMDACIEALFRQLETLGILDRTIVVLNGDHGETLYDHECWFDHHGLYEPTLYVPLIIRYPKKLPAGARVRGYNQHKDLVPTLLDLAGVKSNLKFDGRSLMRLVRGRAASFESEFYITECTWMRKHGWRTPQWKLIMALEPDFHFKPPVELYNLIDDPLEQNNVAARESDVVASLRRRMETFIQKRQKQTRTTNPMLTQGDWHGHTGLGPFKTSQQAYDTLHIGDPKTAARLQSKSRKATRRTKRTRRKETRE